MKRGRISSVTKSNVKRCRTNTEEVSHIQITDQRSFSDLPRDVLVNILLKVSVKRIFMCKCVCKIWCDLISDPEFAKLHADQVEVYPLIRTELRRYGCKIVYLVEPDKCDDHTQLEIPLKCGLFKHYGFDLKYCFVHSCNGLLCLSNPCHKSLDPPIVCNPITNEFINLPKSKKVYKSSDITCYGFGFSPTTNQYKVIRMFQQCGAQIRVAKMAEVHILGTKTWKEIGLLNQPMPMSKQSTVYLNGFLYWYSDLRPLTIFTFDIENERFGSIPVPAVDQPFRYVNVGVFRRRTLHMLDSSF